LVDHERDHERDAEQPQQAEAEEHHRGRDATLPPAGHEPVHRRFEREREEQRGDEPQE